MARGRGNKKIKFLHWRPMQFIVIAVGNKVQFDWWYPEDLKHVKVGDIIEYFDCTDRGIELLTGEVIKLGEPSMQQLKIDNRTDKDFKQEQKELENIGN